MSRSTVPASARRAGGLLVWFAALGGAAAWSAHLIIAWGIDELACASGNRDVAGLPLTAVMVTTVVVPAAVAAAALLASWVAWRRITSVDDGAPVQRTRLVALVGLCANLLFLAIILAGGAAVLVFAPCQS
jgi:hypothetical protein